MNVKPNTDNRKAARDKLSSCWRAKECAVARRCAFRLRDEDAAVRSQSGLAPMLMRWSRGAFCRIMRMC